MRHSQFKSPVTRVAMPNFDYTHLNNILSALDSSVDMQKKQAISSHCSGDIFDLEILQFDWQRLLWSNMTEKQAK